MSEFSCHGSCPANTVSGENNLLGMVGVSFKSAPLSIREALVRRITVESLVSLRLENPLALKNVEMVLLSTCNRFELYYCGEEQLSSNILEKLFSVESSEKYHIYKLAGYDAVDHLFRVTAGLDSLVVGEEQVALQVKEAGKLCLEKGLAGTVLSKLFSKAYQSAKQIREEATYGPVQQSVSSAVMQLVLQTFPTRGPNLLLVGSGKMTRLSLEAVERSKLGKIFLAVRKAPVNNKIRADRLVPLSEIGETIRSEKIDVVITATSADSYLLGPRDLRSLNSQLLVVDISVPRNVDPAVAQLEGVRLLNIDDFKDYKFRQTPLLPSINERISSKVEDFQSWFKEHYEVDPILALIRKRVEIIRLEEVENALSRMPNLTPAERYVVDKMSDRLVRRFLHRPTIKLRDLARDHQEYGKAKEFLRAIDELFLEEDLEQEGRVVHDPRRLEVTETRQVER